MVKPAAPSYDKTRTKTRRYMYPLVEDHIVWLPPPSSFLIQGLGPAYGRVMVAYNSLLINKIHNRKKDMFNLIKI
ncbi:hypothetical protein BpHYR1_014145 [Brachionus plicatilis]|uniref:Uncharacterized protein n=1 Tax=Brachionus plicatilis TaxID=10195 RepID=A0A3M7PZK5_BRAPC|nr:hypothetical protein BpHYR1_014145 [Brachionus plicatilis]